MRELIERLGLFAEATIPKPAEGQSAVVQVPTQRTRGERTPYVTDGEEQ
jgi:hypothetical protein